MQLKWGARRGPLLVPASGNHPQTGVPRESRQSGPCAGQSRGCPGPQILDIGIPFDCPRLSWSLTFMVEASAQLSSPH